MMNTARILVVDDDPLVLEACALTLDAEGYRTQTATGGREALARLESEQFELLLLDFHMPQMAGLAVLKQARELDPNMVSVIITGYGTMENAIEALRAGARGFLLKPFDPEELLLTVKEALQVRRREQENLFLRVRLPILEISQRLMAESDIESFPRQLLNVVAEQMDVDRACLLSLSEDTDELYVAESVGLPKDAADEVRMPASQGFAKKVLLQEEPVTLGAIEETICPAMQAESDAAVACVRLRTRDRAVGILYLSRSPASSVFTPSDLYLLSIIASQITIALENARLFETLRHSEERFRQFFENEPEYCYMISPEGLILDVNKAALEALGYTKEEIAGQPLKILYAAESLPQAERLFAKWAERGTLRNEEITIVTKQGEIRTVLLSASTVRDQDGTPLYSVSVQRDITERKQMEKELWRQTEYLAALHEIGLGLITRRESTELLTAIIERASALLDTPHGFIYLLAPDGDALQLQIGAGVYNSRLGLRLEPGEGLVGKVWQSGQSLVVDDYGHWPERVPYPGFDLLCSIVGVPLISGSQVVGVLGLAHVEKNLGFQFEEIALLGQFSELASIALDNARLYEQAQREIAERRQAQSALELQRDLAVTLSSTNDLQEMLNRVLEGFFQIEGVDCGGLYLVDGASGQLDLVVHQGLHDEFVKQVSHYEADSPRVHLVMAGEPVYRHYTQVLPDTQDQAERREDLRAAAIIPIAYQGQVIAALNLASHTHDELSGNTRNVIEATASQIGGVIARVMAEDALRASEEHYRTLFDNVPVGLYHSTPEGRILDVNRALIKMTGYSDRQALKRVQARDLYVHAQDRDRFQAMMERGGSVRNFETQFRRRDGTSIWVEINTHAVRSADGSVILYEGALEDITERKRAEETLRFTQFAIDRASDAAYWMGPDARFIYVNDAACQNLGYSREELLTMTVHDIDPRSPVEGWADHWREIKKRGSFTFESQHRTGDGRLFPVEITVNFLEFKGREYNVAFVRDITERKRAEEALRRSEAMLQSIFRVAPVGIGVVKNRVLGWTNEALHKMTGYSAEELAGQSARMLYETEDEFLRVGREKYAEIREQGTDSIETWFQHKDGHLIDILLSSTPLDPDDLSSGVVFTALDITDLRQAAEALRQSEARYRGFVEQSYEGVWEIDGEGVTVFANERMAHILGYGSPAEMMGRKFHDFAPRAHLDSYWQFHDLAPKAQLDSYRAGTGRSGGGKKQAQDFTLQKKDGSIVYAILSHLPHQDQAGQFAGATLFITDITERKRAEEALRESETRYRTLFESAGDAILIHDLEGQFLAVNHLACDRLGYSREELLQMARRDTETPEYAALIPKRIDEVDLYGQGLFETVHLRQDGTTLPVELSCRFIEYQGTPAILCIARDLTERKRMEQYLLRTERLAAMGHLAAALAHEINNPLQSIGSCMELVLDFPLEEKERQEYLEAVRQEIERLMSLTTRVLDFARPPRIERHPTAIAKVVHHALGLASKQLVHNRIGVHVDLPDDLAPVMASRDQLAQVFLNLILNAVEAMPTGGRLSVSARPTEGPIQICFQDTGPGLPADAFEKVFEPFHTTKEEGTGLGLAISYSIIQQHGGAITAGNAAAGGAVFTVSLPVAASELQTKENDR